MEDAERRLERLEEQYVKLSERVNDSFVLLARMDTKIDNITNNFEELKTDIKILKAVPQRRWNMVVVSIIQTIVSVVFTLAIGGALLAGMHYKVN